MEGYSSEERVQNFTEEQETKSEELESEDFSSVESDQGFSAQQTVGESSGTHKNNKKYCKLCDITFTRRCIYRRHMKTYHKPYVCKICTFEKKFSDESLLAAHHQKMHSGERFACEMCNRSYTNMDLLQDHMQSHTHDMIFTCQECQNDFGSKGQLMRHTKKAHHGKEIRRINSLVKGYAVDKDTKICLPIQKPIFCDVCKKEFSQIQHLNMHLKMCVTGEKRHSCDVCNRYFNSRKQLQDHQRMKKHVRETGSMENVE